MKLTPSMIKGITKAMSESRLPLSRIAMFSGITYRTLKNWLARGQKFHEEIQGGQKLKGDLTLDEKRLLELFLKLEEASLVREELWMEKVFKFADIRKDPKVYQWMLRLHHKDAYSDTKVEGVKEKVSNQLVVVNLSSCGTGDMLLLEEFMAGLPKPAVYEIEGHIEDAEGGSE